MKKTRKAITVTAANFRVSDFRIVSDFDIRISDFPPGASWT
jgi:hypothetical protein